MSISVSVLEFIFESDIGNQNQCHVLRITRDTAQMSMIGRERPEKIVHQPNNRIFKCYKKIENAALVAYLGGTLRC